MAAMTAPLVRVERLGLLQVAAGILAKRVGATSC